MNDRIANKVDFGKSRAALIDTVPTRVRMLAGCYALTLGPWSNESSPSGNPAYRTPPSRFRLDTTEVRSGGYYTVDPMNLIPSRRSLTAWYIASGDAVIVTWSTGFIGVSVATISHGDTLIGTAKAFTDEIGPGAPPKPSAKVVAVKVACTN